MANTYTITSMFNQGGQTTITGTVNGVQVSVGYPTQVFASTLAFENFVAPLMLAQVPPAIVTTTPLASSFTQ